MSECLTNEAASKRREKRARRVWTSVIVGFLLLEVGLCAAGVTAALHGKPVVEHDYYNKALHWDDQEALVQASAALGWKADLSVGADATSNGERALMLRLTNRDSTAIQDAKVSIAFFHHAHPLELTQTELGAVGGGVYAASVPLNRAGVWEFRLTIHRAAKAAGSAKDEHFVATIERDLLE